MTQILRIVKKYKLKLIEDWALKSKGNTKANMLELLEILVVLVFMQQKFFGLLVKVVC